MSTFKWVVSTVIAGATMAITIVSASMAYVYPKSEGKNLEQNVKELRIEIVDELKGFRQELRQINERLSRMEGAQSERFKRPIARD